MKTEKRELTAAEYSRFLLIQRDLMWSALNNEILWRHISTILLREDK